MCIICSFNFAPGKILFIGGNRGDKLVASNGDFIFINCLIVGNIILRRVYGSSVGSIKIIESMAATSEFIFLIIFQLYGYHVFDSAIHSHVIFGCGDRYGKHVGYRLWVLVHFKVGENI